MDKFTKKFYEVLEFIATLFMAIMYMFSDGGGGFDE